MMSGFLEPLYTRRRVLGMLARLFCLLLLAACNGATTETSKTSTPTLTPTPTPMAQRAARSGASVVKPSSASVEQYGFTLLDDRRVRLSDYVGHVVVLDFYATWCPPCREETPHLVSLQRRYGSQGLHVIGLNVGGPDDRYKVPEYVEEFKIQYTLGFPDPQLTDQYLSDDDRIPQAFVFDRKGRLVKRFISYDSTMPEELERVVQNALNTGAD